MIDIGTQIIFFSIIPTPAALDAELSSSDKMEYLVYLLKQFFKLGPNTKGIYSTQTPIPICVGSQARLQADSPGNCTSMDYK